MIRFALPLALVCFFHCGGGDKDKSTGTLVDAGVVQCTPSNVSIDLVTAGTVPFLMDTTYGNLILDTDKQKIYSVFNGLEVNFDAVPRTIVQQPGFPELLVFSASKLLIAQDIRVNVIGTRALVLLASQDATLDGTIEANGTLPGKVQGFPEAIPQWTGGPGGYDGGRTPTAMETMTMMVPMNVGDGKGPGGSKLTKKGGSWGAGHTTPGGSSADTSAEPGGGVAGNAALVPLIGGSGAGAARTANDTNTANFVCGGGGGGAVQVTSFGTISIGAKGGIFVGGRGGCQNNGRPGGGGGAGGAVLLEGCSGVTIAGKVTANGGGGAAGLPSSMSGKGAEAGSDGSKDVMPAKGGDVVSFDAMGMEMGRVPSGGAGGAGSTPPTGNQDLNGGGGGSYGRIRVRAISRSPDITGIVSPAETSDGFSISVQ